MDHADLPRSAEHAAGTPTPKAAEASQREEE
jgi:hypothetical protein